MMKKILIILLLPIGCFAQKSVSVTLNGGSIVTTTSVTEQKNYYNGEFYWNHGLNTSTGAITATSTTDISDFLPIEASTSITISTTDSSNITIYGWTYDASKTAISEIRANALISTKLKTYTFTTPSNAAYLTLFTKYSNDSFNIRLRVKSTNTITYQSPILPETFAGANQSIQLQNALNFQRFINSVVSLNGTYYLDSNISLSSGNRIVMNNSLIKTRNTALFKNITNGKPTNSGNSNISITGIGTFQNFAILLTNVSNFTLTGLRRTSTNYFAFTLTQCRYGTISDIYFNAGVELPNQDGIHLLLACHDITINNIYGQTGDDMISLVNNILECGLTPVIYEPYNLSIDIYNIYIKNIFRNLSSARFGAAAGNIRLLTEDGYKMHDIVIDNVTGTPNIKIQDATHYYKTLSNSNRNDMYNISISNLNSPVFVYVPIKNSSFFNVQTFSLPDSSMNIYRKYNNAAPEFIDSVKAGTEFKRTMN